MKLCHQHLEKEVLNRFMDGETTMPDMEEVSSEDCDKCIREYLG